jgi:hypothetical protein
MAHCRGERDGAWLVLSILQATAGEAAGEKVPVMYELAQRGAAPAQRTNGSSGSSSSSGGGGGGGGGEWLYLGQTNQLPSHADAEPLYQLLQLHVPEVLRGSGGDADADAGAGGGGGGGRGRGRGSLTSRQLCFAWGWPALGLPTAPEAAGQRADSRGRQGWYLDLLRPAAEPLAHMGASAAGGSDAAAAAMAQPGVVSMDVYLQARQAHQQQQPPPPPPQQQQEQRQQQATKTKQQQR